MSSFNLEPSSNSTRLQFPARIPTVPPPPSTLRHLGLLAGFSSLMPKSPHQSRVAGGVRSGAEGGRGDGGGQGETEMKGLERRCGRGQQTEVCRKALGRRCNVS